MLFITNREPTGSTQAGAGAAYGFDLEKNAPSNAVYYCQRNGDGDYIELGSQSFMQQINDGQEEQLL